MRGSSPLLKPADTAGGPVINVPMSELIDAFSDVRWAASVLLAEVGEGDGEAAGGGA